MDRLKLPPLPTPDAADRKVIGVGIILLLAFLLVCVVVGGGLGLGVFAFRVMAGW